VSGDGVFGANTRVGGALGVGGLTSYLSSRASCAPASCGASARCRRAA
jgi:hypothetical protein